MLELTGGSGPVFAFKEHPRVGRWWGEQTQTACQVVPGEGNCQSRGSRGSHLPAVGRMTTEGFWRRRQIQSRWLVFQRVLTEHLLTDVVPGAGDAALSCTGFSRGAPGPWKRQTIRSFISGSAGHREEDPLACALVRGCRAGGLLHAAWAGRTRRTWPLSWKMRGSEPSKCSWQENSQRRDPGGRSGAHGVWPGPGQEMMSGRCL